MRVPSFLADEHVPFDTIIHPPVFTASRRAGFLHVPGRNLAKCVLLVSAEGPVLAIVPATRQVDLTAVAAKLEVPVRLARSEEIPAIFGDCEWGGLVPFGSLYGVPSLLDNSFEADDLLVFEAHRHVISIRMHCRDFERLEKPRRMALSRTTVSVGENQDPR
jgi:Ala-tRNA(Pro) deacylase